MPFSRVGFLPIHRSLHRRSPSKIVAIPAKSDRPFTVAISIQSTAASASDSREGATVSNRRTTRTASPPSAPSDELRVAHSRPRRPPPPPIQRRRPPSASGLLGAGEVSPYAAIQRGLLPRRANSPPCAVAVAIGSCWRRTPMETAPTHSDSRERCNWKPAAPLATANAVAATPFS